jgi:hypothetical protein
MTLDLQAIEELKQLKARYFRLLDTKQWDAWGMTFTADAVMEHPANRVEGLRGREAIVSTVRGHLADVVTIHHGHMPEIEILAPDRARGVWAMYDKLLYADAGASGLTHYEGYGHYLEQYVREADGQWRIAHLHLRRLHLETRRRVRDADASRFWS